LHKEIDDQFGLAETLHSVASAYQHLGRHPEAVAHYRQALSLCREFGDRSQEADTLACLGDTHLSGGNPVAAREAWQLALAILGELGHPQAAQVRGKLENLMDTAIVQSS
jgi:tetratricopeptide (TPR) repeat protein